MSDGDEKTFRLIALITVVSVFVLLFMIVIGGLYAEYECAKAVDAGKPVPDACSNGNLGKLFIEIAGLIIGTIAAIKVFMGKM